MQALFSRGRALIGVVHLPPLPGAPRSGAPREAMAAALASAARDAEALARGGCDALIVENFGDSPFYPGSVEPATVAAMAPCIGAVREAAQGLPLGVNVLRNDGRAALGLAAAMDADFVRVNVLVGAAVTDQGIVEGRAAELLRERRRLGADSVAIFADIHVKHATPLSSEPIEDAAEECFHRGLADALVVSGPATGRPADVGDVESVRARLADAPLFVGSGVTPKLAPALLAGCTGAIVGTWLKREGRVDQAVDEARVRELRAALDSA